MIDLDMFKVFKGEEKPMKPFVAAVLVSKSADLDLAKARIEKAGMSIEKMEEKEDGYVFTQQDAVGASVVIKADDDIAFQVSGLKQKGLVTYNGETESFKELFATHSVFPTVNTATCALNDVIYNIAQKADSPSDAALMVKAAIDEFSSFMVGLVSSIPSTAFKMEDKVLKSEVEAELKAKAEEAKPEGEEGEEPAASEEPKADEAAPAEPAAEGEEEKPEEPASEEVVEKGDKKKGKKPEEDMTDEEKKMAGKKKEESASVDEIVSKVLKGVQDTLKGVEDAMGERLSKLETKVDGVADKAENAEKVAKTAEKALGSTVLAQPAGDRALETVKKSEEYLVLDTAFDKVA